MLKLTRKAGEKIMIGDDIEITIVGTARNRNQFVVGIDAPRDVPVDREEIYWQKRMTNSSGQQ